MKRSIIFLLFFCLSKNLVAQDGLQIGASVTTGLALQTHRSKTTGIWSSQSGYGFSFGIPFKYWTSETRAFNFGLDYEYVAYDNRVNNNLVSSTRYHSLHLPLTYNINLFSTWYAAVGTGLNYFIRSRTFSPGNTVDISNSANPFQPYLSLGINTLAKRGSGFFELGVQARYHFLDLWKKTYPNFNVTTSKILSMDLVMRFYF